MGGFSFRVGPRTTRLGVPVVRDVGSCLEGLAIVGIDDSGIGSGEW